MSSTTTRRGSHPHAHPALRWSNWNLLLLVPLVALITPLYNRTEPHLFGFPFFYWLQFLFIPLGVLCVALVYVRTRKLDRPMHVDGPADPGDPMNRNGDKGAQR